MIDTLEHRLKIQARSLGFELAGIAAAAQADGFDQFQDWLARDFAGDMSYLRRLAPARRHPAAILPDVRSVVMLGLNYYGAAPSAGEARIARYACGEDYHVVLRRKLNELLAWVQAEVPGARGRGVVDTAPLLERDFARRAGLGWFGKNTMLIHKRLGSFFFLAALLLDLDLHPDAPFEARHCGTCTACLDACPTQAFVGPYQLDARRCISYLTIELRGPVAEELRAGVGPWLFGCDICQDVCPWNRKAPWGREPALQPHADLEALDPAELVGITDAEFRRRFRGTALWRTKRQGLARNAALVLGNTAGIEALPALEAAAGDADPVVQEAARWAMARIRERAGTGG
ncbi:MAG: tRNA epoxyqueuosine(34) reductase QueG [Gemmataceae bacterium]|nr:tRNA epoxyqueuosine(34) reductase QueG [Gemmataceae bacterium]